MDPCELTILISAFANAIAKNTSDDNELLQISIMFDYLSDTLDAIIAQRALIKKGRENELERAIEIVED